MSSVDEALALHEDATRAAIRAKSLHLQGAHDKATGAWSEAATLAVAALRAFQGAAGTQRLERTIGVLAVSAVTLLSRTDTAAAIVLVEELRHEAIPLLYRQELDIIAGKLARRPLRRQVSLSSVPPP